MLTDKLLDDAREDMRKLLLFIELAAATDAAWDMENRVAPPIVQIAKQLDAFLFNLAMTYRTVVRSADVA